jgi:acyl-CoA synthetase (AMP-forming)/AMP-acid ligase II
MEYPLAIPLLEALHGWVLKQPNKLAFSFLDNDGEIMTSHTYLELFQRSKAVASHLSETLHLSKGDRVLLVFPPSLDFMVAFLGCLMGGIIAVPVFPPDPFNPRRDTGIFFSILNSSGAVLALTSNHFRRALSVADLQSLVSGSQSLLNVTTWECIDDIINIKNQKEVHGEATALPDISQQHSLAFLQYTSGSTSEPKGVMIGHDNLAHNLKLIITGLRAGEDTVVASWLPQYHDMGLIGSYLGILYCGGSGYYLSPMTFIKNPVLWIKCISKYRATHMQAPNFAYSLTAKKFLVLEKNPVAQSKLGSLDLSSVRHMINAAEPVDAATIEMFYAIFGKYGLPKGVVFPTYGLAEHTVYVCSNGSQILKVDKFALERHEVVPILGDNQERGSNKDSKEGKESKSEKKKQREKVVEVLVGCGRPTDSSQVVVKIVHPETCIEVQGNQVGEIWIDSPSKAKGYWSLPEKSKEDFEAQLAEGNDGRGYLRTGDLGFLYNGELFICGRLKDMIIIHGKNYYPHDLEKSGENIVSGTGLDVRKGCSAAIGHRILGKEVVLYFGELSDQAIQKYEQQEKEKGLKLLEDLIHEIRREISSAHGVSLSFIGLVDPRTIPKTSSGKIARQWVKKGYFEGSLKYLHAWSNMDGSAEGDGTGKDFASTMQDDGNDGMLVSELISPDAANGDRLDPTGLPFDFVAKELQKIIGKCLGQSPETIRLDIPVSAMGLDSPQGIQLQSLLDHRFTIPLPDEYMFETDTTVTTLATSYIQGGSYHHRPIMVDGVDVFEGLVQRKLLDNSIMAVKALRTICRLFTGFPKKTQSKHKMLMTPHWFKEHQIKAHVDTMRFEDSLARKVLPMSMMHQMEYFYYALETFGIFFWIPVVVYIIFRSFYWPIATLIVVAAAVIIYLPNYEEWPPSFRNHRSFSTILRYFSYRSIIEAPLSAYEGMTSIYCFGPHGVFTLGPTIQAMINGLIVGEDMHFLAANAAFSLPIYNIRLQMLGVKSVERKSFVSLLEKGRSVGMVPGGIAEMFSLRREEEALAVLSRKGFVKIALETGCQIVPCYCFGNSQTFSSGSTPWLAALSRMLRTSLILFWGRFGLPIPHRTPLLTVVGKPLLCPKVENPSPELINEYHELYLRETRRIYDTYKNTYDWQNRKLQFL